MDTLENRILSGDKKAFQELYSLFFKSLVLYAYQIIGDTEESEDIVQSVIINLWNKREQIKLNDNLKPYLYKSVKNACLNTLRHRKVINEHETDFLLKDQYIDQGYDILTAELATEIDSALDKLTPQQRKIFEMSRNEDKAYKEIAEELDTSTKNIEYHMSNALKSIRKSLAHYFKSFIFFISLLG